MKMRKHIGWMAALLVAAGCAKENRWDCVTGMGDMGTESRSLAPFASVYTQDRIDVDYRYDSLYRAEVRFGENLLKHIETEVVDGELRLQNTATCNWVRDLSTYPKVTLYAPAFSHLENRGNGDILFMDTLRSAQFHYTSYDSNGKVDLLLRCSEVEIVKHTGHCDLEVRGVTDLAQLYNAGVGRLEARRLRSPNTLVNNSSFQDMGVYSSGYLYVTLSRQGNVCYSGEPDLIEKEISGSGQVRACSGN